jgi:pSer/pThr/pTyr-binding forkhead associated (FHA) protein
MRVVLNIDDRQVAVTRSETVVGRAPDCDIVLLDKSVSRAHASIVLAASGPAIRDLGSRNGTWVNGLRIGSDRRLRPGDRVRFGCAAAVVGDVFGDIEMDQDDGWLAVQSALLLKESTAHRLREADEILFRLAEAMETRLSIGERFSDEVSDAALAAVIDYATARKRPGWTRWAMGIQSKLGAAPGQAMRRSLENAHADDDLRASGTVPIARIASTTPGRRVG